MTSGALISGLRSYVATFGLGTSTRVSPAFGVSAPPLRKNVTCAYFSVSAMWSWRRPCSARTSARTCSGRSLGNATGAGIVGSYSVRHTKRSCGTDRALEALERRVGERARDLAGAVRAEVEEDERVAVAQAARRDDRGHDELVGDACRVRRADAPRAATRPARPRPRTIACHAFSTRSQRLSRSIA